MRTGTQILLFVALGLIVGILYVIADRLDIIAKTLKALL